MADLQLIPIETFAGQVLSSERAARIMTGWRIDGNAVYKILLRHVREMGIFTVPHSHREIVTEAILSHIKNSPEILALVKKAEAEEKKKQQNRHST